MPMGLFPMASLLRARGFDVEIIHLDLESAQLEKILDLNELAAVGLDCHWVNQTPVVLDTAALLKRKKPDLFIFLGGFTASYFTEEILTKYPFIDAVIRGDGEIPVIELCQALKEAWTAKKSSANLLKGVQNLAWRQPTGEIVLNRFSYVATSAEIDHLDFGRVDLLRHWPFYRDLCKFWTKFSPLNRLPLFFLEVGRGCQYHCSFCGGSAGAQRCMNNRDNTAVRSVDSVIATIKRAVSSGYSLFYAGYDFEGSESWYSRLFEQIKREGLSLSFGYGCWRLPSKALIDLMSECFDGVIIEISPETFDHRLRRKNKDKRLFYTNAELEQCLDYIGTRPNIKVQIYFGYFLPFDTEQTIFNTLDYMTKLLLRYASFAEVIYSKVTADPASYLFTHPDKYGVDMAVCHLADYVDRQRLSAGLTLFRPGNMTEEEAAALAQKIEWYQEMLRCFVDSVSLVLDAFPMSNIILTYLRQARLATAVAGGLSPASLKAMLLDICSHYNIRDDAVGRAIHREYAEASKGAEGVKPVSEAEKLQIRSTIQRAKDRVQAEFDI